MFLVYYRLLLVGALNPKTWTLAVNRPLRNQALKLKQTTEIIRPQQKLTIASRSI
jgi:hypothetical protein